MQAGLYGWLRLLAGWLDGLLTALLAGLQTGLGGLAGWLGWLDASQAGLLDFVPSLQI